MASIVTSILSCTVGLLWNKARDSTAYKLKDGDTTDEKIREIVVRELNDIKSKLDGLSRKDLLSSYGFLKEGVNLLNASLDKSNDDEHNETRDHDDETSTMLDGARCILNQTLELSRAVGKLKTQSNKEFESAKKRFEEARKTATHAFFNEALSIKDRIFAAKLRVCSEILECLESPEIAMTGCETFLQDLHSLPAIREIFSVYLNGGIKSRLNKAERLDNVKSVMMINYALYQFNFKFGRKRTNRIIWPGVIDLAGRRFNPILNWQEVSTRKSWVEGPMQPRNDLLLDENIRPYHSALNSHGDIVAVRSEEDFKVFSKTGESKLVTLTDPTEDKVIERYIKGLAIDNNNNVYIVRCLETRGENGDGISYVLNVLDDTYNVKYRCALNFLKATGSGMKLAINKNNDIVMIKNDDPYVYVCDNSGHLKFKFERDLILGQMPRYSLSISNENDIMISSNKNRAVDIYTERGNLKSVINLPVGHKVVGVVFHHVICKIVVLSFNYQSDSYFLLCFSKAGELETLTFFSKRTSQLDLRPYITSHPSVVPIAVVWVRKVIYM